MLVLFIFSVFTMPAQTYSETAQASISALLERGFEPDLDRFGLTPILPHTLALEARLMVKKGREFTFGYWHRWVEDNILFEIYLWSREYANIHVVAFILEEGSYGRWLENRGPAALKPIPDEPRFGKHAGRMYAVTSWFFRVNETNEPPTKFISIGNGEGRYIWF